MAKKGEQLKSYRLGKDKINKERKLLLFALQRNAKKPKDRAHIQTAQNYLRECIVKSTKQINKEYNMIKR